MLLCRLHAIRHGRHAEELPPLRLPRCKFQCPGYPRLPVYELLEVRAVICVVTFAAAIFARSKAIAPPMFLSKHQLDGHVTNS